MKLFLTPPNQGYSPSDARVLSKGSMPLQSVRSLAGSRRQVSATSPNVGNLIHCEAVAKTFDIDLRLSTSGSIERLYKVECKQKASVLHTKLAHFDGVVFSFANMISLPLEGRKDQFDDRFNFLTELVEAINIPIFVFGMGMQQALPDLTVIPDSMKNFLKALNAKASLWGVRGVETEAFLHSLGCTTAEALGCPSLYVYPESILNIKPITSFDGLKGMTAGYLDRRHLLGYEPDRLEALRRLNDRFQMSYIFQNDLYTLQELENVDGIFEDATNLCNKEMLEDYFKSFGHSFDFESYHFFRDPRGWREYANGCDFYFGDRFHGGVAAMQVGRPSLFIWNDLRVRELTGHFNIPSISLDEFLAGDPVELMQNATSKSRLSEMKDVYEGRAEHYFGRTAEFGLFPNHERYKPIKRKAVQRPEDLSEELMEVLADGHTSNTVLAAMRLFELTGYDVGITERLIGATTSIYDSGRMDKLAKTLVRYCAEMSGWNEAIIYTNCRMLMRDAHYEAAAILLATVCETDTSEPIARSTRMYIEALARSKRTDDAIELLSKYQDGILIGKASVARLQKIIG